MRNNDFFNLPVLLTQESFGLNDLSEFTWVDQFTWAYNDYFYLSEVATWLCSESSTTSGRQVIISLWMSSDTIVIISNILSANSCKRVNSLVIAVQDKCTSSLKHNCYLSSINKNNMYTRYNLISGTVNGTKWEWFFLSLSYHDT